MEFICDFCQAKFKERKTLNKHVGSIHSLQNFKCDHCDFYTNRKDTLSRHKKKHDYEIEAGPSKFTCPKCPKQFLEKKNLNKHIMSIHSENKFKCHQCSLSHLIDLITLTGMN